MKFGTEKNRIWPLAILGVAALSTLGCESKEGKRCASLVKGMETRIRAMNPAEKKSVEFTLAGLSEAKKACQAAGKTKSVADIEEARENYEKHLARFEENAENPIKQPKVFSTEELMKSGDPRCPKGQGYHHPELDKLIKCSGPTLIGMDFPTAVQHFTQAGYSLKNEGNSLAVSKADISFRYEFENKEPMTLARCLQINPSKTQSAKEAISYATNVPVEKIEEGKPLALDRGELSFEVSKQGDSVLVTLGTCEAKSEKAAPEKKP